jgi:hypothetical protein
MSDSPFCPDDLPFTEEHVRELSQAVMASSASSKQVSEMMVNVESLSDSNMGKLATIQLFKLTNALVPMIQSTTPILQEFSKILVGMKRFRRQMEEDNEEEPQVAVVRNVSNSEKKQKRTVDISADSSSSTSSSSLMAAQHDLVFVHSFLMTMEGLSCLGLVEMNHSWMVMINVPRLAKLLSSNISKSKGSFQFTRKQKRNDRIMSRFAQDDLSSLLMYNLSELSHKPYINVFQQKWPKVKQEKMLVFRGVEWMKRWFALYEKHHEQITHWRSEMEVFSSNEEPVSSTSLPEQEQKAWIRFRSRHPTGAYDIPKDDVAASSDFVAIPFTIGFGWIVNV